jgi:hypothetical protein
VRSQGLREVSDAVRRHRLVGAEADAAGAGDRGEPVRRAREHHDLAAVARQREHLATRDAGWGRIPLSRSSMKTAKEEVRDLLDQLPEDASLEDIQYHICVTQKIQKGLDAEAEGQVIPQAEVERRMARWTGK